MSAWILTKNGVINACVNGSTYSVQPDHPMYDECLAFIRAEDYARFAAIANVEDAMQLLLNFDDPNLKISVKNGKVYYNFNGQNISVNNYLTNNLLEFMRKKLPIRPVILFLENLMQNPSPRAVKEVWSFMQHKGLPLTADGCFLGYKRVRGDWLDYNSGTILNTVGTRVPEMMRNMVDDNWGVECSEGYHVGSLEYVKNFHNEKNSHVTIVKVNPKDVVSVPREDCTKMRCTVYEVIAEYDQQLKNHLPEVLYNANTLEPVEVGGERLTQIQQAVPAYSWTFGSEISADEENDEDSPFPDEEEDDEYDDDDSDDDDDLDEEEEENEDWDDEEEEEEENEDDYPFPDDEVSEFGITKAAVKWLDDKSIDTSYLNDTEVKAAINEGDAIGILQALYGAVVKNDDQQAKQVLTDRYYRGELMNLLQD